MRFEEVIRELKKRANPNNVAGMACFGINPEGTLGISVYELRALAKTLGKNHELALSLWDSKIHEARLLAGFVDDPLAVTGGQMDKWVADFDSWDVCDQVISNLFDKTSIAYDKAFEWAKKEKEFVKRAGFVMMAALSVHDKKASNKDFVQFFPEIKKAATDERNFVKKAVNWALRQIGKRNERLNKLAIKVAEEILKIDSKSAKWIAKDAIRELRTKKFLISNF